MQGELLLGGVPCTQKELPEPFHSRNELASRLAEAVAFLACDWKVSGSNLGRDAVHPKVLFFFSRDFCSFTPAKFRDILNHTKTTSFNIFSNQFFTNNLKL
jgi:hypothetical protein